MADNNKPRRGPAWAYVLGGAIVFPFAISFVLALFQMRVREFNVEPLTLAGIGALIGWIAWRAFSKLRAQKGRASDLDV